MKTSKIQTVIHTGTKEWNGKPLEKYTVAFENGDSGTLTVFPNGTTPTIGLEMEYEIQDNGYGAEIKPKKSGGGGGGYSKWTPEQVAQQDAIKLTQSYIQSGGDLKFWKAFFVEAKEFMIESIKEGKPATTPRPADIDKSVPKNAEVETVDDLPF